MISYGDVALELPGPEESAWLAKNIPGQPSEIFSFWHPKGFRNPSLNPRAHFAWWLQRPFKLNCYFDPWGASRWSYAFCLANSKMLNAIMKQTKRKDPNINGTPLDFIMDDDLGSFIVTSLYLLPPVPVSKVMGISPQLGQWILPLVDQRYFWWERAARIGVTQGVTTWTNLYLEIAAGLDIALAIDPISAVYLKPSAGFNVSFEYLPLILDWTANSVGQRIVRRLDDSFAAINSATGTALMMAQVNDNRKYAGGTINLGIVDG